VLVGPSGCGKTTALRCLAGLEEVTDGSVLIADKVVNEIPPKDRDIAMVFQSYALYPHMTVYDNMAFGLKLRKIDKAQIKERVEAAAKKLGIEMSVLEKYELGVEAVPLPTLEAIAGSLNRSLSDFQDQKGFVGVWLARQRAVKDYLSLPSDLQAFVSKPVNRPYLELAVRLSEMSVDRLRSVAEGLLEITY